MQSPLSDPDEIKYMSSDESCYVKVFALQRRKLEIDIRKENILVTQDLLTV
jgi:hypothetical protein